MLKAEETPKTEPIALVSPQVPARPLANGHAPQSLTFDAFCLQLIEYRKLDKLKPKELNQALLEVARKVLAEVKKHAVVVDKGIQQPLSLKLFKDELIRIGQLTNAKWEDFGHTIPAPEIITGTDLHAGLYVLQFKTEDDAEVYLEYIKSLLPPEIARTFDSVKKTKTPSGTYTFCLTTAQYFLTIIDADKTWPKGDYIFKTVRSDEGCFIRAFVESIIQLPNEYEYHKTALRKAKRLFTVTADGIFLRLEEKEPHQKAKVGYSAPQSATFAMSGFDPKAFGHNTLRRDTLVGFIFENMLLGDIFFSKDNNTISRPTDFATFEEAEKYYKEMVETTPQRLFSQHSFQKFRQVLRQQVKEENYNEVMARLIWLCDGSCRLAIFSDTIEARLIAIDYSRIIKLRLQELAKATGKPLPKDYQVFIVFYLPGLPRHRTFYTLEEQEKDMQIKADETPAAIASLAIRQSKYAQLLRIKHTTLALSLVPLLLWHGYVELAHTILECHPDESTWIKLDDPAYPSHLSEPSTYINAYSYTYNGYPIHQVAKIGSTSALKFLLKHGATTNAHDIANNTPLHTAAMFNKATIIRLLRESGADCNALTSSEQTPLLLATLASQVSAVAALLPFTKNKARLDAFAYAAALGNMKMCQLFVGAGVSILGNEANNSQPLAQAFAKKWGNIALYLLSHLSDEEFAEERNIMLKRLKEIDIPLLKNEGTYLPYYVSKHQFTKNDRIGQLLIAYAKGKNNPQMALKLLARGVHDKASLDKVLQTGSIVDFKTLSESPYFDVKQKGSFGTTLLHLLVKNGQFQFLETILQRHPDQAKQLLELPDDCGMTPFHLACASGWISGIRGLLVYQPNPHVPGPNGLTPINLLENVNQSAIDNKADLDTLLTELKAIPKSDATKLASVSPAAKPPAAIPVPAIAELDLVDHVEAAPLMAPAGARSRQQNVQLVPQPAAIALLPDKTKLVNNRHSFFEPSNDCKEVEKLFKRILKYLDTAVRTLYLEHLQRLNGEIKVDIYSWRGIINTLAHQKCNSNKITSKDLSANMISCMEILFFDNYEEYLAKHTQNTIIPLHHPYQFTSTRAVLAIVVHRELQEILTTSPILPTPSVLKN